MSIYDRVAARCAAADIPITIAGIAEVDRFLREEGRAEAYCRAQLSTTKKEQPHGPQRQA